MSLISEIRAALKRKRGVTIDDVTESLARLRQERASAEAALAAASARRHDQLRNDAPDDAFFDLDRESDHYHLILERVDTVEPELLAQLDQLRDQARRDLWREIVAEHDLAAKNYLAAAAKLCERHAEVIAAWDRATACGFVERFNRFLQPPVGLMLSLQTSFTDSSENSRALRIWPRRRPHLLTSP